MPARPFVANVLKVALTGTIDPYNWACILHCQWSGTTPTATILNALANDVAAGWSAGLKAKMYTGITLSAVTLTDLTSGTGAQGLASTTPIVGTNAAVPVSANTSVLVTYPSSFRYRGGHPRTYLPSPAQGDTTDMAHLSNSAVTAWTTDFADLQNTLYGSSSGGTTLGGQCAVSYVYSTPTPGTPRTTPLVMPIAQGAFTVHSELASQRRRIGRK